MYDVSSRESFQKVDNWLNELDTYSTNHDLIKMLIANKVTLRQFFKNKKARLVDPLCCAIVVA